MATDRATRSATRTRAVLYAFAAIVSIVLVAWWLARAGRAAPSGAAQPPSVAALIGEVREDATAVDSTRSATPGATGDADRVAAVPAPGATAPLPAANTRLADMYDDLARRARAGDTRASCRLAAELERCGHLPVLRSQLRASEARALEPATPDAPVPAQAQTRIDQVARMGNTVDAIAAICDGVPAERAGDAFDWLLRAAAGGHVGAMSRFARAPMISQQRFLHELERLAIYRDRAPGFALAALAAGDPEILPTLAVSWGPKETAWELLAQVMPQDRVRARAASRLYQMVRNLPQPAPGARRWEALDPALLQLTNDEQAAADALANDWFARWYGSRTQPARPYVPAERDDFAWCEKER